MRNMYMTFSKKSNDWKVHIYIPKVCSHSETIFFDGVCIILVNHSVSACHFVDFCSYPR